MRSVCSLSFSQVGEKEKGKLLGFYKEITKATRKLYRTLGLNFKEIDNNGTLELAHNQAIKFAAAHLGYNYP